MKHRPSVLLAEDEPKAREALRALLEDEGYCVTTVADGGDAVEQLSSRAYDAALLDIRMPLKDGLAVLRELRGWDDPPAVLIMTAYGSSSAAIEAMKLGAFDYLTKPINFSELAIQLERAIETRRRNRELEVLRAEAPEAQVPDITGNSQVMQRLYKLIGQVAAADSTVLIRGESGTGKELIAAAIHHHSARTSRKLVKVNCASIPEQLLEAELFGHERGAFTGAAQRRIGRFEYANGGTIFLDEIGELSPATQAKLLRVLQEHTIERLGSNVSVPLDVRILAATNRDLEGALKDGAFREDLYYRINVVTLYAPPLRERREDIAELAAVLLRRGAARLRLPATALSLEAVRLLEGRDWPGNVRELEHCIERALVLSRGGVILPEHILWESTLAPDPYHSIPLTTGLHDAVTRLERSFIVRGLEQAGGNRTRAAEILFISRRLLYDKIKEFGLE